MTAPESRRLTMEEKVTKIEACLRDSWRSRVDTRFSDEIAERTGLSRAQVNEVGRSRYQFDSDRNGFSVAFSCRLYPRKVAKQLVDDGLLKETNAVVCDGDGFHLEPERYRVGFELTEAGQAAVDVLEQNGAQQ